MGLLLPILITSNLYPTKYSTYFGSPHTDTVINTLIGHDHQRNIAQMLGASLHGYPRLQSLDFIVPLRKDERARSTVTSADGACQESSHNRQVAVWRRDSLIAESCDPACTLPQHWKPRSSAATVQYLAAIFIL